MASITSGESFANRGGDREVHVGDPERIEVGAAVPLEGTGFASGDGNVEIGHGRETGLSGWMSQPRKNERWEMKLRVND